MIEQFNVTSIGYSHIKSGKPCQDFSASYSDGERNIVTACDGHGGEVYIRSHKGSKFASLAILRAMLATESLSFRKYTAEDIEHNLKLNILCEWNRLVREDLAEHPIRKSEVAHLTYTQIKSIKQNPAKAYGTTLSGAMLFGNRLICVGLGDGGCFLVKNGELYPAFPEDEDEPVANVTYSLCGEKAFEHMNARIFDMRTLDGVLICTDGILGPYQSTENFKRSFVRPVVRRVLDGKTNEVKNFVCDLGLRSGIGDDVSLAMILKGSTRSRFYR
ncbi:MAG: protein phosphatase 2C domain-containing protein [Ruminococcaceae bacterium]|nr:protein phosphatase 2C domain-containing protein [Oscillospiraceae bacterium]